MSDFGTRLERELIAAAEREQRRPRMLARRPSRGGSLALAIGTAVAVLALVVVPALRSPRELPDNGQPLGPLAPALLGDHAGSTGRRAISLILERTRYTLVLPVGEDTGDISAAGSLLVLTSDGDGVCRQHDERGLYRFQLHGRTLRLHRLTDGCRARAEALNGEALRYRG